MFETPARDRSSRIFNTSFRKKLNLAESIKENLEESEEEDSYELKEESEESESIEISSESKEIPMNIDPISPFQAAKLEESSRQKKQEEKEVK